MTTSPRNHRQTFPFNLACSPIPGNILHMSYYYFTIPALVVLIVIYIVLKKKGKA